MFFFGPRFNYRNTISLALQLFCINAFFKASLAGNDDDDNIARSICATTRNKARSDYLLLSDGPIELAPILECNGIEAICHNHSYYNQTLWTIETDCVTGIDDTECRQLTLLENWNSSDTDFAGCIKAYYARQPVVDDKMMEVSVLLSVLAVALCCFYAIFRATSQLSNENAPEAEPLRARNRPVSPINA